MNLKISVKNFGPIRQGEIELNDLNVFIGSNNAGKSYFATLIYTLMQSLRFDSGGAVLFRSGERGRLKIVHLRSARKISNIADIHVKKIINKLIPIYNSEQEEVSLDQDAFRDFQKNILDGFLSEFTTNLKRNMTPQLEDIVRFGEDFFEIKISIGQDFIELTNEKNDLNVKNSHVTWKDIKFVLRDKVNNTFETRLLHGENVYLRGNSVMIALTSTQISRLRKSAIVPDIWGISILFIPKRGLI